MSVSVLPAQDRGTDKGFVGRVLAVAKLYGWRRAHFRAAQTSRGWRTAVAGDAKGFPDLLLLRGEHLVVAELKGRTNAPTLDQRAWMAAWRAVGADVYLWRPDDLERIAEILR